MELEWQDPDILQYLHNTAFTPVEGTLSLVNGRNVEVSGTSESVIFAGAQGAGAGMFDSEPYTKLNPDTGDDSFAGVEGKALRSINGRSGTVLIGGDKSVEIERVGVNVFGATVTDDTGIRYDAIAAKTVINGVQA